MFRNLSLSVSVSAPVSLQVPHDLLHKVLCTSRSVHKNSRPHWNSGNPGRRTVCAPFRLVLKNCACTVLCQCLFFCVFVFACVSVCVFVFACVVFVSCSLFVFRSCVCFVCRLCVSRSVNVVSHSADAHAHALAHDDDVVVGDVLLLFLMKRMMLCIVLCS